MFSIEEIKQKVAPVSKRHGLKNVYLFGSYARGEARQESDVDLLIEPNGVKSLFELGGIYADFKDALGTDVDVVTTGATDKFLNRIEDDRILIYAA